MVTGFGNSRMLRKGQIEKYKLGQIPSHLLRWNPRSGYSETCSLLRARIRDRTQHNELISSEKNGDSHTLAPRRHSRV